MTLPQPTMKARCECLNDGSNMYNLGSSVDGPLFMDIFIKGGTDYETDLS